MADRPMRCAFVYVPVSDLVVLFCERLVGEFGYRIISSGDFGEMLHDRLLERGVAVGLVPILEVQASELDLLWYELDVGNLAQAIQADHVTEASVCEAFDQAGLALIQAMALRYLDGAVVITTEAESTRVLHQMAEGDRTVPSEARLEQARNALVVASSCLAKYTAYLDRRVGTNQARAQG